MAPSAKVKKAFIAMKAIGISQEKTKVALKKLLQVYDKKWELIEAENYRVLADAIFEYEETETSEKEKKSKNADRGEASEAAVCQDITVQDEPMQDEPERPLKRLRLKHQGHGAGSNGQPSPLAICGALKTPKPEPGEQGTSPVKKKQPQMITLITPKDEPVTDDVVSIEPLAVVLPEPLNEKNSSKPDNQGGSQDSQRSGAMVGVDEGMELVLTAQEKQLQEVDVSDRTSAKLNIATSTLGKVQLSMACNLVSKEHKMRLPDLETVLKKVNDDCRKRYKITDPGFSLTKMMIQLCDGVEEPDQTADDSIDNNRLSTIPVCSSFDEESHDDVTVTNDISLVNSSTPPLASTSPEMRMQHESDVVDVMNLKSIVVAHPYDTSDITMGREIVMVSLEKFACEFLPTFHYISQNVVSDNADVKFSLAQFGDQDSCFSCHADCVSSSSSCNCARHNGGESPYTGDGLIKEQFLDECVSSVRNPQKHDLTYCKVCQLELLKNEDILDPCKGHLKRKFLKECYTKCGCSQNCGNRVVQGGLRCKLQVFWTPEGKGWGLRALENLPKGAFVCEFVGEILTIMELRKRYRSRSSDKHSYSLLLDSDWGSRALKKEEFLCLDATLYGNVARFINHRCTDANLIEIPVEVETPSRHYYHMALFTTRNVNAFEELTWDYGVDFDDNDGYMETFSCLCGSQFCRNMKRPRPRSSLTSQ